MDTSKISGRITPLWIVAAFVTLTEAVLGYAVTQTQGCVQIALTVFVISFALLVFGAFFVVLWNRPYVFYPPSEYGDTDPKKFVEAVSPSQRIREQIQLVEKASNEPENRNAMFAVINSLIDDFHRQLIILMHEKQTTIPFIVYFGPRYELARKSGEWSGGGFSTQEFARRLDGTDLLRIEARGPSVSLTQLGHEFGKWLLDNRCRADFFETPFGGWGDRIRPEGIPPEFYKQPFQEFSQPVIQPSSESKDNKSPSDESPTQDESNKSP